MDSKTKTEAKAKATRTLNSNSLPADDEPIKFEGLVAQEYKMVEPAEKPKPDSMFPVRLLKNYMPEGKNIGVDYDVVEAIAPPFPGVHQDHKLWAGTVVKLPRAEAVRLLENKVTETLTMKDERDRPMQKQVTRRMPLAERADDIPL
jgi:hypothetical protein